MLISEVIQIRSKLNERVIKFDAILTKLGGKTYNTNIIKFGWEHFILWVISSMKQHRM